MKKSIALILFIIISTGIAVGAPTVSRLTRAQDSTVTEETSPEIDPAPDESSPVARAAPDGPSQETGPHHSEIPQGTKSKPDKAYPEAKAAPDEHSLEVRVFRVLNKKAANPILDALMPVVTDLQRWRIVLLVVWSGLVIFGGARGRWAAFMLIPLVAASDQISSTLIKPLAGRMRPCEVLGNVHLWYGPEGWMITPAEVARSYKSSFSFPSSHAANITASMLFLGLAFRRWIVPLLFIALLVSYSRIYIGVHWTSDAVGGIMLGALLAWGAYAIFVRIQGAKVKEGCKGEA